MRITPLIYVLALAAPLANCATFPEIEVSEAEFNSKTPYPDFVPLDELLNEPEPSITDDLQEDLTARRDDLQSTPSGAQNDPLLDRLEALRKKRDDKAAADPVIDEALRKRLEEGITAPSQSE